jgi:hypothetical protein
MSLVLAVVSSCTGQKADPEFNPLIEYPAYTGNGPQVCIDEAHYNSHTAIGLYRPFAQLLEKDGYRIQRLTSTLRTGVPSDCAVLVIVNAAGGKTYKLFGLNLPTRSREHRHESAFAAPEIDSVRQWIERGGSVLLVADHYPYGSAAAALAGALGVEMSGGFTEAANVDPAHARERSRLMYSSENGLLGDHPITQGRLPRERVSRVETFTGQSLRAPGGSALLTLGDSAIDYVSVGSRLEPTSAEGRCQAVALMIGRGRVVVFGEAAALTAQIDDRGERFGMQLPGLDNQQFVLNVLHWLTHLM